MEVSKLVKLLEKELDSWTNSSGSKRVSASVERLEKKIEFQRKIYRKELQRNLGKDFSVEDLMGDGHNSPYMPIERYFFPIKYKEKWFGVARPFAKNKAAILYSGSEGVFERASEIMKKMGYQVTNTIAYPTSSTDLECLSLSSFLED